MKRYCVKLRKWVTEHPVIAILAAALGVLSYTNIYVFGFWLNVPVALRPFLDAYFFSSLVFEFFMSAAIAAIFARITVLIVRFLLSNAPLKVLALVSGPFGRLMRKKEDRRVSIHNPNVFEKWLRVSVKQISRRFRRLQLVFTLLLGIFTFATLYLGQHAYWYILICLLILPITWMVVSRVELRRNFATLENTKSFSPSRVYRAFIGFILVFFGICVFLAGTATFTKRMDTSVSVVMGNQPRNSSLIAVTSKGIIVGDLLGVFVNPLKPISVDAYFIPFDALKSVGQRH